MAILRDPVPTKEIVNMGHDLEAFFVVVLEEIIESLDEAALSKITDDDSLNEFIDNVLSVIDK